ncbi:DUF2804 family protein, partial [Microvirga sp. 3-52]|nr:DUF2804 family protein [Microvirga sp. 3-52]
DGQMTKVHEDVLFTYDDQRYMKPWKIKTKFTDNINLTFTPFFERISKTDAKLFRTEVNQLIGYFNGHVRLQDDSILHIRQMLGCAEDHIAKW